MMVKIRKVSQVFERNNELVDLNSFIFTSIDLSDSIQERLHIPLKFDTVSDEVNQVNNEPHQDVDATIDSVISAVRESTLKKDFPTTKELLGDIPDERIDEDIWKPMTFYPTYEEFKDLQKYVSHMEALGAHKCGIAKIVPPAEWVPRKKGYHPAEMNVGLIHPIQQNISSVEIDGAFKSIADRSIPPLTVEKYVRLATNDMYATPPHNSYDELEELYWKQNLDDKLVAPIYGADVNASLMDPEESVWNISKLDSLLTEILEEQILGVNMSYLYFGMWKATFSWHVEDMDLYGVNFLHHGAPKTWYCIPPQEAYKLEQVAQKLFPGMSATCFNLLRHKAVMISDKLLEMNGVKVNKMVQEERNMIIVFPHAYHAGFNHGFNIAEAANFALPRWVEYGKRFRDCLCRGKVNEVSISMDPFVRKCQPERLTAWLGGSDWGLHPEDPWYLKRCYIDAFMRRDRGEITDDEFDLLKLILRKKRQIPRWFRNRFEVDYNDSIVEVREIATSSATSRKENMKGRPKGSYKVEKLLKVIDKATNKFNVKVMKLKREVVDIYLSDRQKYIGVRNEMERQEEERKAMVAAGIGYFSLGTGAARGTGFSGVNVEDLLEKKSRVVCRANRKHRFKACGKCTGCRNLDCSKCEFCLDKPKFGGSSRMKQKCKSRICVNPTMVTCDQCDWTI